GRDWKRIDETLKSLLGVTRLAVDLAVIDVVLKYEAYLRIEDRPMLGHELELHVGRECPVLDLRASGKRRGTYAAGADRMYDRAQSLRSRLAAQGGELLV